MNIRQVYKGTKKPNASECSLPTIIPSLILFSNGHSAKVGHQKAKYPLLTIMEPMALGSPSSPGNSGKQNSHPSVTEECEVGCTKIRTSNPTFTRQNLKETVQMIGIVLIPMTLINLSSRDH